MSQKNLSKLLVSTFALVIMSFITPGLSMADDYNCEGASPFESIPETSGDVIVRGECRIDHGRTIHGDVKVMPGGRFVSVGGNVGGSINSNTAEIISGFEGVLKLSHLHGSWKETGEGGMHVEGSEVWGDVINNGIGRTLVSGWAVGSIIHGSLKHYSSSLLTLKVYNESSITIYGDLLNVGGGDVILFFTQPDVGNITIHGNVCGMNIPIDDRIVIDGDIKETCPPNK